MKIKKQIAICIAVIGLLGSGIAQAGVITGGSSLLNQSSLGQLESWLGQGQLELTNVFTKTQGSTGFDFHAAADGKGATYSVMSVTDQIGQTATIGGYNPTSWRSDSTYTYSPSQVDRTAFVFNLDSGTKYSQSQDLLRGNYQTYNFPQSGPTFGGGHDIYIHDSLSFGHSRLWTYGTYSDMYSSIVSSYGSEFRVGALEVFTIGSYAAPTAPVPEPETYAMFLAGLGLIGAVARRRKQK